MLVIYKGLWWFYYKLKNFDHIPQDAMMVIVDVVDPYSSIPHHTGLQALKKVLDYLVNKKIYMNEFTKIT